VGAKLDLAVQGLVAGWLRATPAQLRNKETLFFVCVIP
jgi:hypothetical protein